MSDHNLQFEYNNAGKLAFYVQYGHQHRLDMQRSQGTAVFTSNMDHLPCNTTFLQPRATIVSTPSVSLYPQWVTLPSFMYFNTTMDEHYEYAWCIYCTYHRMKLIEVLKRGAKTVTNRHGYDRPDWPVKMIVSWQKGDSMCPREPTDLNNM